MNERLSISTAVLE